MPAMICLFVFCLFVFCLFDINIEYYDTFTHFRQLHTSPKSDEE